MSDRITRLLAWLLLLPCAGGWASGAFDQSRDGFVNNDLCLGCHARQALEWRSSDHAQAMQPANDRTVLGDFNNVTFQGEGLTARFTHDNGQYRITVSEAGHTETLDVAWTFGVDPLQQYLVSYPNGRLQAFPVAWDVTRKAWFHLNTNDGVSPDSPLHWRKRFYIANSFCIECHTTDFSLGYSADTGQYHSQAAGHNVNCQACHGPGQAHLDWTRSPSAIADKGWDNSAHTAEATNTLCAGCHARRHPITPERSWAAPLFDELVPSTLREGLYHPDGQIQDEVFEFGSFAQSRMHEAGLSCTDCHNPHTLKPRIAGNALCTSCHEAGNARFPSLKAGQYDTPDHHHHTPGQAGSQCVDCHMPATTYMKIDPRRDHRFGTPRPDLSLALGTPNACNGCHTDRTPQWALDALQQWFPGGRHTRPDRATVIAQARQQAPEAITGLKALVSDPQQPTVWRATAIELLAQYGPGLLNSIAPLLDDPSPWVRSQAVAAFETQPAEIRLQYLPARLNDDSRAVRIEAARLLAGQDTSLPAAYREAFTQALEEYRRAQAALPDHPEGYANLGNLAYHQGQRYEAIRRMKQAIATDPHFIPAYQSLAVLYSQIGANDRAIETLQQAIANALPEQQAGLQYSLGLALAERQDMAGARRALEQAVSADPGHAAAHYNLGLVLQQSGEAAGAIQHLQHALALQPGDDRSRYALLTLLMQEKRDTEARPLLEALLSRYPNEPELLRMQQRLAPGPQH